MRVLMRARDRRLDRTVPDGPMGAMAKCSGLRRALALAPVLLSACGGGEDGSAGVSAEDLLVRQRASAYFAESERGKALELIGPLADREDATPYDLIHAASVALDPYVGQVDRARAWVERARAIAPDDQRVRWASYRLAKLDGDFEASEALLRSILRDDPDDLPTKLALASALTAREAPPVEEIVQLYRDVIAVGPDFGGSWYKAAVFRMSRILIENGREDEARSYGEEHARLVEQGVASPSATDTDIGTFGSFPPPPSDEVYPLPAAEQDALAGGAWSWRDVARQEGALAGARGVQAFVPEMRIPPDARAVSQRGGSLAWAFATESGPEEILVWGAGGLAVARWVDAAWELETLLAEPVHAAAVIDLGDPAYSDTAHPAQAGDGDADFAVALNGGLVLLERRDGALRRRPGTVFAYAMPPRAIVAVDFDHEGDLDLLLAGEGGATLLRNDGVHEEAGAFTDATGEAGIPNGGRLAWCLAEDLDRDKDVDLLYGGPGGVFAASNERGGRFSDASAELPAGLRDGARVRDADGDGWADLVASGGATWLGGPSGAWRPVGAWTTPPGPALLAGETVDVPAGAVLCDKEGDGAPDLVALEGDDLVTRVGALDAGATALRLALQGVQDNHRGVGALVEVILGPAYRRSYWRGGTLAIATYGRETVDVVRVTWPNGVIQHLIDVPGSGELTVKQRPGLQGSCPFLYAWDGERFAFITDVLGNTPLGLPMAPGRLVPPDHDEYVLVRGEEMRPKDGEYVIQITEELREVTYLDRVRLEVLDHPAGVEVFPNERFTFPPFPEHRVHSVEHAFVPEGAKGSDGREWSAELRADDRRLATPFEPYGGQFQGLCPPWFLELSFDPEAVRDADRLRLVLNGWLLWTNASVNVAAARHPKIEFVPPLLQVPDAEGGWRDAGVLGFPAGKLKTMVVDVTDAIDRSEPRVRVLTSLQLYWDSIRLAVDAGDAPLVTTSIEPSAAELWLRGFSRPLPHPRHAELERFDWDALDAPRWNQHPGSYTKLGSCTPLIGAIDDRFAILGAGDALTVRFPADEVPPLRDGWERDFLVFFDGWAKDRDPNTLEALYVEPLPFHGMSGYPYGDGESFPATAEHAAWRAEWNTRPATVWIEPLAPRRPPGEQALFASNDAEESGWK